MSKDMCEQSMEIMRNVVSLMSEYGLSATPKIYAVLYGYVSGENLPMQKAFNNHIEVHENITEELCDKWFMEHVCVADEKVLFEAQEEVRSIMENVLKIIANVNGNNDDYVNVLSSNELLLAKKPSLDALLDLITDLREETASMRQSSEKMRCELNDKLGEVSQLRDSLESVKHEASMDYLTGVANRKGLMEKLPDMFDCNKGKQCFAMIDIDFFKKFNDTYGHLVGDKVLRFVANIIKNSIKGSDLIARYGGEEFVVVFSDTGADDAVKAAENIREAIEKTRFVLKKENQNLGTISVSIGLSEYQFGESFETCLERADKALYYAKQNGRNRVISDAMAA